MSDAPTPSDVRIWQIVPVADLQPHETRHPFAELIYVVEGVYETARQGTALSAAAGELCYYPPGGIHHPRAIYPTPPRVLVAQWHAPQARPPWDRTFIARDPQARVLSAMTWMWHAFRREYADTQPLLQALLQAVLLEVEHVLAGPHRASGPAERVAELMRHTPGHAFDLRELARHAGLSPWQLSRTFRETFGLPPMRYLRRLRLEKALHLLKSTQLPVKTIASRVGYGSGQHLSRLIHRRFGKTPTELRTPRRTPLQDP